MLSDGPVPTGQQTITCGEDSSIVLLGTVIDELSGLDAPDRAHVVIAGGVGWEAEVLAPLSYQSSSGVHLLTILKDIAKANGEKLSYPTDAIVGQAWALPASAPMNRVLYRSALSSLAKAGTIPGWWVDGTGTTQFVARPTGTVDANQRADVLRRDLGVGMIVVGVDSPGAFSPGKTTADGFAIAREVVIETAGELKVELWAA